MRAAIYAVANGEVISPDPPDNITGVVGENLRRLRTRRGLSLERLSKASNVSRAMLGQIELGRSSPTITLLSKVAKALDVPLTVLLSASSGSEITVLRAHRTKWFSSGNGRFASRALFPLEQPRKEEFFEARLSAQSIEEDDPHSAGTTEHVVVTKGTLEIRTNGEWTRLEKGDSAIFTADRSHAYRNPGPDETIFHMTRIRPGINP